MIQVKMEVSGEMTVSGEMDISGEKDCIGLMNVNEMTFFTGIGENLKKQAARLPTLSFHQIYELRFRRNCRHIYNCMSSQNKVHQNPNFRC